MDYNTQQAIGNLPSTGIPFNLVLPEFVRALAWGEVRAARADRDFWALVSAVEGIWGEIIPVQRHILFRIDMIQSGAGTSTNLNSNEVIANLAPNRMGMSRTSTPIFVETMMSSAGNRRGMSVRPPCAYRYVAMRQISGHAAPAGCHLPRSRRDQVAFKMSASEPMLHVEALHLSDAHWDILEDRWICFSTVPEIGGIDLSEISANVWLVLNRPYCRRDLRFYAISADEKVAELLETTKGAALSVIERTTWIENAPITTAKAITMPGYQLLTPDPRR
ncbi:MAG: UTRA domain-containing protein [Marivita sp.]|uniref:UTRA domain-containing protein n=1 Tax=Marivita sp. TaxID=2003365 RepID=UPI0025BEBA8A|nr:UTRA domain-containing protein [Marivita sp.]MCI5112305.1 UTRA domain-containing protein [Marivita sp.]